MSFISIQFVVFFSVLLLIYRFMRDEKHKQILLLVASYIFYASGSIGFLILLAAMSLCSWYLGIKIASSDNGKPFLITGLAICLLVLGIFKYYNFFVTSFVTVLGIHGLGTLNLILPLGISFYTFQAISYLCDVYYEKISAEKAAWKVMLYIGFFPQIISGPIVKARDFLPQLHADHRISKESISYGIQYIAFGLFKKMVIADRIGVGVNAVYAAPTQYSGLSLLVAVIGYSIQIYCDFSGYSDMAIGIAYILGYDLGQNFNLPYISKNPSDFWQRWHISLSSWFKEYVYIPLGGNRAGKYRTYLNLFITMLLSGLWHGANWTFLIWGALHGVLSMLHKWYKDMKPVVVQKADGHLIEKIRMIISCILNVSLIWFLWIPFRSNNIGTAATIIKGIVTNQNGISYIYVWTVVYTVMIIGAQVFMGMKCAGNGKLQPLDLSQFGNQVIFCTFILLIAGFSYVGETAFIYANF